MHAAVRCLIGAIAAAPFTAKAQSYFQQQVDYRISVRLDDATNELFAHEEFDYTNNAPQALDTLWLHLWPNAYRDRNTALCRQKDAQDDFDLHFAKAEERGYIDSLDFRNDGVKLAWGLDTDNPDIGWVALPKPLATGEGITLSTPFHVKVPDAKFSRLGHTGQAYYITQWFPKPAVFDNTGWHAFPYLDQGEFYSEFGSFDVDITLPANYVLAATGERIDNTAEDAFMDSLAAVPPSFVMSESLSDPFPASAKRMKTVRFKQDNVHDFAWFADKRYKVRKGAVVLPHSGRSVTTWTLFTPRNAALWSDAITYVNESVRLYSKWVGDYRYASCTAVDGTIAAGGGMEYPMITIIGNEGSRFDLDDVIAHEVGHNWFYGMLGSNERDHPWMDEGMNSFFEQRYIEERYPGKKTRYYTGLDLSGALLRHPLDFRTRNEQDYRFNARRNWDQPPETTSAAFTETNYGSDVYSKTALVLDQLFHDLGSERFDSCTHTYFDAWAMKHPQPADVQASYEKASGEKLDWCFNQLLQTSDKVDVIALRLKSDMLTYRSTATTGFPFPLTAWNGADNLGTTWVSGVQGKNKVALPWSNATRIRIDDQARTMDIDRRNNEVRSFGLLKRTRPPAFRFLGGLERDDRRSIFWTPAVGYNTHDGVMAGLALYNTVYPSQRFEWALLPMYGFTSGRLAGGGRLMWNDDRVQSSWLRNIHAGVSGFAASLYGVSEVEQWYQRLVPSIQFDPELKPTGPQAYLRYRSVMLWDHAEGTLRTSNNDVPINSASRSIYHEVSGNISRVNGFNPFDITVTSLNSDVFNRVSLDANWSSIYDANKHRVSLRLFTGTFLSRDRALMRPEMGWRMYWGSSDLLYDHLYTDRQYVGENTAIQTNIDQGGFRTPTAIGTSDTWIAAMNMEVDLPFALPLVAFASYGAAPFSTITQDGKTTDWSGNWEAGIGIRFLRDIAEVWVPLTFSKDIQNEQDLRGFNLTDRIRIVLALEKLDPTQTLRKLPH
ncbi:MAG: M1 family metallopeptidase [Flavobacteriales bacterium]|nr:M1 family metallopeptidase [Flavobacteriales bacterium]